MGFGVACGERAVIAGNSDSAYEVAAGAPPSGGDLLFVLGHPEVWARAVWASRAGFEARRALTTARLRRPSITIFFLNHRLATMGSPWVATPFGLASEAALHEPPNHGPARFYPQLNRSNADIHALGVVPKVCRKRATNAPGC